MTDREKDLVEHGIRLHHLFGEEQLAEIPFSVAQIMLLAEVLSVGAAALEEVDLDYFTGSLREALSDLKHGGDKASESLKSFLKRQGIEWDGQGRAIDAVREAAKQEFVGRMMNRASMVRGTPSQRAKEVDSLLERVKSKS